MGNSSVALAILEDGPCHFQSQLAATDRHDLGQGDALRGGRGGYCRRTTGVSASRRARPVGTTSRGGRGTT